MRERFSTHRTWACIFVMFLGTLASAQGVNDHFEQLYSAPAESGLLAVHPFPTPEDVCQVIGENQATVSLFALYPRIIGCPQHELEAIGDLVLEGAFVIDQIGPWVLLAFEQAMTS